MFSVLDSIRSGKISQVWDFFFDLFCGAIGPKVAAYLSYWSIDWGPLTEGPTLMCLYRESFIKDIDELRKNTNLTLPVVMAGFTRFQLPWFPKGMQIQTYYQCYNGPDKASALLKSKAFAACLITLVQRKRRINGLLSANFDYWQDCGFKEYCRESGIPFLVLSREHPIIPRVCDEIVDWYLKANFKFEGTAIAVAGQSTKDVLLRTGHVCEPSQVNITGLPRYDAWRRIDCSKSASNRKFVTLLTFTNGYYADATFKEVLNTFIDLAHDPEVDSAIQFLIKTKDLSDTCNLEKMLPKSKIKNLVCGHEFPLPFVLAESRLVINYNSLSLVEAAFARAPIVLPAWGDCQDKGRNVMYSAENPNVRKVALFAYSSDQLKQIIKDNLAGSAMEYGKEDALAFVNDFIHFPIETTSSQKFVTFFESFLSQHKTVKTFI